MTQYATSKLQSDPSTYDVHTLCCFIGNHDFKVSLCGQYIFIFIVYF